MQRATASKSMPTQKESRKRKDPPSVHRPAQQPTSPSTLHNQAVPGPPVPAVGGNGAVQSAQTSSPLHYYEALSASSSSIASRDSAGGPPFQVAATSNGNAGEMECICQDIVNMGSKDCRIVERALDGLSLLADSNKSTQVKIAKRGGCKLVVHPMLNHPDKPGIQWRACKLIVALSTNSIKNSIEIADADGIAAVVKTLEHHGLNQDVSEHAIGALNNLFMAKNSKTDVEEAGGIEKIIQLIVRSVICFKESCYLQTWGIDTLGELAKNKQAKAIIRDQNICSLIGEALDKFRDQNNNEHKELQRLANKAFMQLRY